MTLFLFSETSPSAYGLDKGGVAESGRALKFRLLRTIAKKHRKQLYYDDGLKELLTTAQEFAKANGLTCDDVKVKRKPQKIMISFALGQPGISSQGSC